MRLTAQALNRATLARQLLLHREPFAVGEGVRRVLALQAQEPASPYLALWNRLAEFAAADLDAAFADRTLVKATLLRTTLHTVHADDYAMLHAALQPTLRAAGLDDRRFTASGLSRSDGEALVPQLLEFVDRPRTAAEVQAWLAARLDGTVPGVWRALRCFAPLVHAPTGGPWSFGPRPLYTAARSPTSGPEDADAHLRTLVWRYLEAFGPASVADVAQFAMVPRARVRRALRDLGDHLEHHEACDGTELADVPGAPLPAGDTPAPPRLLGMWDSVLLAYADRGRVLPPDYRRQVIRANGDVLPTLLVDGYVAGVWRAVESGIEAIAFHELPDEAWQGLLAEAGALTAFLADREPQVYRRYHHWWRKLPSETSRLLLD